MTVVIDVSRKQKWPMASQSVRECWKFHKMTSSDEANQTTPASEISEVYSVTSKFILWALFFGIWLANYRWSVPIENPMCSRLVSF
jgi:hypothetical protein